MQDFKLFANARENLELVTVQILNVQRVSQHLVSRNLHKGEASLLLVETKQVLNVLEVIKTFLNSNDRTLNLKQLIIALDYARWNVLVPFLAGTFKILESNATCDFRIFRPLRTQLSILKDFLPLAISTPLDDLFSLDSDHPTWQKINDLAQFKILGKDFDLKQQTEDSIGILMAFNATISSVASTKTSWLKKLIYEFGPIYYLFNAKQRNLEGNYLVAEASQTSVMAPLNMWNNGWRKKMVTAGFPQIAFKRIIHVGRNYYPITDQFIKNQYKTGTINEMIKIEDIQIHVPPCSLKELLTKTPHTIKVRVLSSSILSFSEPGSQSISDQRNIVLHIHGGGFVAQSSRSYQGFTRQLANHLKCPVFSVDYGLAPKHVYPEHLNDCWQVYLWLRFQSQNYLGFQPNKIILMGDSSGGNLVTALTVLCIKLGVEVPDGAVIAYPLIALGKDYYSPSMLISLNDQLLPYQKLRFFSECYQGGFDAEKDPLLSPLVVSDELLDKFPPTRLVVGTNDPLFDESWRFAQKMVGKDFRILVYPGMPHAFLSLDQVMIPCKETVRDLFDLIGELFNKD